MQEHAAELLAIKGLRVGRKKESSISSIFDHLCDKYTAADNKWKGGVNCRAGGDKDMHGCTFFYRQKLVTDMVGPYGCITFSCWLALNAPAPGDDADENARQVKAFVTKSFKDIWPAPEYMRLYVQPNGQCEDIEELPMIALVRFGTLPHRRNGPVDVHGSYGPDDCTIVAINGAVGHAFLSRALLVEQDPLYAEGGIVLWDEQLRAIINSKSPYDLQPRVGLANSYAVFAKTQGIFLVATELHLRDGTMTLHTIYVDMWRRVVHFGLNDGGTDMISFLIERADERDCETARDNLVNDTNFPVDP
jgi:hypothetical protein